MRDLGLNGQALHGFPIGQVRIEQICLGRDLRRLRLERRILGIRDRVLFRVTARRGRVVQTLPAVESVQLRGCKLGLPGHDFFAVSEKVLWQCQNFLAEGQRNLSKPFGFARLNDVDLAELAVGDR